MVNIYKKISLQGSILDIVCADEFCLSIDAAYRFYTFSLPEFSLISQLSLGKNFETPHRHANSFKASTMGFLNIPIMGTEKSVLLKTTPKVEKIMVNSWHEGDIESAAFSHDGKMLATGGTDGKVFVFDTKSKNLIFSLPPRGEYISDISFSKSNDLIAASSYDKFTIIYSTVQNKILNVIKLHDVTERAVFCNNDTLLYMVSRNGRSILYDLVGKSIISQEAHFSKWPSCIAISPDDKYAIVGTRGDRLYVIRLEDNQKMLDLPLEYNGCSSVSIFKNTLAAGFIDGTLVLIDYNNGEEKLVSAIGDLDFKSARKIIQENIFLTIHPSTKVFDEHWKGYLARAIERLNNNEIDEAVDIVEPFLFDPQKQKDFESYLKQQGPVKNFLDAITGKDYQKAYKMASLNSFLKKTTYYQDLEGIWVKTFNIAKRLLEENPVMNRKKAEVVLKPFSNTEKKDIIFQLLKNTKVFIQADQYIKEQKLKEYFKLTEKFFFLKDSDLYEKVVNMGQRLIAQFLEYEKEHKYEEATELAKKIMIFPMYQKIITEKINMMNARTTFIDAVTNGDDQLAFRLLEKNESLKSLPQFQELQKKFETVFEAARQYAFSGEPKSALLKMSSVRNISFWREKVASIMKISYLNEMRIYAKDREVNWDLTFKRYIKRYGKDAELKKIAKEMNKYELLEAIEESGSSEGYKSSEFVDYIVVHKGDA